MTTTTALRPFVHIFRTDSAKYVYDVNSGRVAEITDLNWEILANWDKEDDHVARASAGRFSADEVARARDRIIRRGEEGKLFSTKRPKALRSPYGRDAAEHRLSHECNQLILSVTDSCNMRCKYCYYTSGRDSERTHGSSLMSWETAEKALRLFFSRSTCSMAKYMAQQAEIAKGKVFRSLDVAAKPCVGFYGGEPLINWPLMRRVIEYVRGALNGDQYLINCTINGTLLTPEIMGFMAEHSVTLSISLDGPKDLHDRYRRFADGRETWDVVVSNLRHMRENMREYYDDHVNLLGVIAPPNDLVRLWDFIAETDWLPKRSIRFNSVDPGSPSCFWSCLRPEEREVAGGETLWPLYVEAALSGKFDADKLPDDPKERKRLNFLRGSYNLFISHAYCRTRFQREGDEMLPDVLPCNFGMCLPGQERLFVAVDGRILPCERLPSEAPDLQIGHVDAGLNVDAIMRLAEGNTALTEDKCINCWNVRMCSVPCHSILGPDGRLSREAKLSACEAARRKTDSALSSMCEILEKDPKALKFMDAM
jgi:uncharacterized protein